MDRIEFLSILRESLEGCIPLEDVEENVTFYRNYFDNADGSEQEVIQELGDPRLIARTIIEAYKASKGPMADYYTEKARSEYSREHSEYHDESGSNSWSEEDTGYSKAEQIKRWIIGSGSWNDNICRLWWKYSFRWKSGSGHIGSRRTGND